MLSGTDSFTGLPDTELSFCTEYKRQRNSALVLYPDALGLPPSSPLPKGYAGNPETKLFGEKDGKTPQLITQGK